MVSQISIYSLILSAFLVILSSCKPYQPHAPNHPVPGPSFPPPMSVNRVTFNQSGGMMGLNDRVRVSGNWEISVTQRQQTTMTRALGRGEQAELARILSGFSFVQYNHDERAFDGLMTDLQASGTGRYPGTDAQAKELIVFLRGAMGVRNRCIPPPLSDWRQ